MELMELGSNKGIAGMEKFKRIEDVLSFIPFFDQHTWCAGENFTRITVAAVLPDGSIVVLEQSGHITDAGQYVRDVDLDADTIGVQISRLPEYPAALIFEYYEDTQNNFKTWEEYLPLAPPDWQKIRRRCEDSLRKTADNAVLFDVAQKLNVKLI
jgi:hypothetical protein